MKNIKIKQAKHTWLAKYFPQEYFKLKLGHLRLKIEAPLWFYLKKLQDIETMDCDLEKDKYVYFPLHYQPELTTSAIGGNYVDQLLALEELSTFVPDDCQIYIKENPIQNEYMRGKYFFQRLKEIPKIKIISRRVNTWQLIRYSKFVATITGTAGWEAISGGKTTLIFGNPWYKRLEGVFVFSESINYEQITNYKVNYKKLESDISELLSKTANGIVDGDFFVLDPDFDLETSTKITAKSIDRIIQEMN